MKVEGAYFSDSSSGNSGIYTEDVAGSRTEIFNSTSPHTSQRQSPFVTHRVEVYKMTRLALRGLHNATYSKVVSCVMGKVFAVVVDLRPESPSFR